MLSVTCRETKQPWEKECNSSWCWAGSSCWPLLPYSTFWARWESSSVMNDVSSCRMLCKVEALRGLEKNMGSNLFLRIPALPWRFWFVSVFPTWHPHFLSAAGPADSGLSIKHRRYSVANSHRCVMPNTYNKSHSSYLLVVLPLWSGWYIHSWFLGRWVLRLSAHSGLCSSGFSTLKYLTVSEQLDLSHWFHQEVRYANQPWGRIPRSCRARKTGFKTQESWSNGGIFHWNASWVWKLPKGRYCLQSCSVFFFLCPPLSFFVVLM